MACKGVCSGWVMFGLGWVKVIVTLACSLIRFIEMMRLRIISSLGDEIEFGLTADIELHS
jgi:hypothetical protein